MAIPLTCHSTYSLATPAELVQTAAGHGMSALGLTDHNLLTGSIEFVTACRDAGIQPILGLEIDFEGSLLQLPTLGSLHGTLDAILFPDAYRAAKSLLGSSVPLLVTGVMEMDTERGEPYLRVERVALVKG